MTLFVKYKGKSLSPSPNSPPVTVTPLTPPAPNSSPPSTSSPPSQSPPPTPTTQSPPPSTSSPPPSSPPPTSPPPPVISPPPSTPPTMSAPPPVSTSPPPSSPTPPTNSSPPPASPLPPAASPPPPATSPPPTNPPPSTTSPPPPATSPPPSTTSPPPPATSPPPTNPPPSTTSPPPTNPPPSTTSPPPPAISPPPTNPPPSTTSPPPTRSPPPSPPSPPSRSPPPPRTPSTRSPPSPSPPPPRTPSTRSPPSPSPPPPTTSPPLPSSTPPPRSPPPSSSSQPPPASSSPPPTTTRPPPRTPPSSEPPTNSPPPPPVTTTPPPPPNTPSPPPSPPSPSTILPSPPGTPSNNDSSPNTPSNNGGISTGGIIGISAVLALVLLTVIITVSCCIIKRKKKISRHNDLYNLPTSTTNSPKSDSGLLKIHTSENGNQSANQFIYTPPDTGGFGYVYKGCLVDGTEVAVKELKIGGGQGEREFTAEVEIIGRIHHRYLVSLVGYCVSENNRLLVYEYVPNNTLYFHLHGSEVVLDWSTRVKVASGAARGIAYLHEDCHPRIIHRDIKSSNILLDKNFEARVSDFGLAKLAADLGTHITTRVMGTFGYMAPEYASSGKLTEKSDVYSFGVVLLELITGRKPVDASQPLGDESLVEWARPLLSHALETEDFEVLVDPKLGTNYVAKEMFHMIEAAAACVRHSAAKRPRMGQIVRAFESMETEDLSNGMRVGESEIFNSAQQSAEIRLFNRMAFGSQNYSTDFFTQGSVGPNGSNER
ncbi:unnamed protein product [Lactuca saligna]|uniref:non-specific serine/threonine protein kinase n=1 Tax=Lactuca saligna TaxID=75948 RepID=A0AA35YLJ3_LACSI|nr:unnamed protein product [Lactuca saligna]